MDTETILMAVSKAYKELEEIDIEKQMPFFI